MPVTQIPKLVTDSVLEALGKAAPGENLRLLDTTNLVSMGKKLADFNAMEPFFGSLALRITKTVYFVRAYKGRMRNVFRDEHEYGAFIQKVYYGMPEASNNAAYEGFDAVGHTFTQKSPYDIKATIPVDSAIFGGKGTWENNYVRPVVQIKEAFLSLSAMLAFIDGMTLQAENKLQLDMEALASTAVNTAMMNSLWDGKKARTGATARNLLAEYNALNPTAPIATEAECLVNMDFLKYASKEIGETVKNMRKMSTVFNTEEYTTFTDKENCVVEVLGKFAEAVQYYLQADTFHKDLVALPRYEEVPFWQTSGKNFTFDKCSAINVKNGESTLSKKGILCNVRDIEACAAYFGERKTWEFYNEMSDVMVHGDKAVKGYAVDKHANCVTFFIEAAPGK